MYEKSHFAAWYHAQRKEKIPPTTDSVSQCLVGAALSISPRECYLGRYTV